MPRSIKAAILLGAAASLAFVLNGCSLLPKEENALQPPLVKPAQENYRTVKVEKGPIVKKIDGVGYLESVSTDQAQFTAQGGRIDRMAVKSGDMVKKGDILVELVNDDLDIKLKEQELAVEKSKLAYREAVISGGEETRIASLQMELEQLKLDRLRKQFDSKRLLSNIDGQVVFVEDLKKGDVVEAFQTLVTVADPTRLRVALRVDNADDIKEADVGMAAEVELDDTHMTGKVVQTPSTSPMSAYKEQQERYAKTLYIDIPQIPKDAAIGDSVVVGIVTKKKDSVLKIPRSGLRSYLGRTFVRVLEEGKRIREIDVEQGLSTPTEVEILSGLEEGQDIILQ